MNNAMTEMLQGKRRPPRKSGPAPTDSDEAQDGRSAAEKTEGHSPNGEPSADGSPSLPVNTGKLGVMVLLGAVTMMFIGFTSTYVVRKGALEWGTIPMPSILWATTAVLLLSSFTIARSKGALKAGRRDVAQRGLLATLALGLLFVGGQWLAWQAIVDAGVLVQQSAHATFFYLLTIVHVLHVAGGLIGLAITLLRNRREPDVGAAYRRLDSTALYWHFVDGLWVYLFVLLFFV